MTPPLWIGVVVFGGVCLTFGCENYNTSRTLSYHSSVIPEALAIETPHGSIRVAAGTVTEGVTGVVVARGEDYTTPDRAETVLSQVRIVEERDESALTLRVAFPREQGEGRLNADVELRVPPSVAVSARAARGSITVQGLRLQVARTDNAPISLQQTFGDGQAETLNAAVTIDGHTGSLEVHTTNGTVEAMGLSGNLIAETSNAHIRASVEPPADGRVDLQTTAANIWLTIPTTFAAEFEAVAPGGRVSFGDGLAVNAETEREGTIEGYIGGKKGGIVRLRTNGGNIQVLPMEPGGA